MTSEPAVVIAWLVFNLVGQWSLLVLLLTFFFAKRLPQRSNPFLINYLLVTFLGTIPPAILLYSGHQSARAPPSSGLCYAQAALVDGVPPMFGTAQVALFIDTWSEIRSVTLHTRSFTRSVPLKYFSMIAPYMMMWFWVFASFIAAAHSQATHKSGYVYCINISDPSNAIRGSVGLFMLVLVMIELTVGLCIGLLLYRFPAQERKDPAMWRSNLHFSMRISTMSLLQLIAISLSVGGAKLRPGPVRVAYELLTSMNGLATFLIFETQKAILQTWKTCGKTKAADGPANGQHPAYSTDGIQERLYPKVIEEALSHGEGQIVDGFFKPWLGVGESHEGPLVRGQ